MPRSSCSCAAPSPMPAGCRQRPRHCRAGAGREWRSVSRKKWSEHKEFHTSSRKGGTRGRYPQAGTRWCLRPAKEGPRGNTHDANDSIRGSAETLLISHQKSHLVDLARWHSDHPQMSAAPPVPSHQVLGHVPPCHRSPVPRRMRTSARARPPVALQRAVLRRQHPGHLPSSTCIRSLQTASTQTPTQKLPPKSARKRQHLASATHSMRRTRASGTAPLPYAFPAATRLRRHLRGQ